MLYLLYISPTTFARPAAYYSSSQNNRPSRQLLGKDLLTSAWYQILDTSTMALLPSTCYQVSGTMVQVLGTKYFVPRTCTKSAC